MKEFLLWCLAYILVSYIGGAILMRTIQKMDPTTTSSNRDDAFSLWLQSPVTFPIMAIVIIFMALDGAKLSEAVSRWWSRRIAPFKQWLNGGH